ncbi:MAG: hypothetical protein AAGJ74_13755 [Pseudomonadota bacterium]
MRCRNFVSVFLIALALSVKTNVAAAAAENDTKLPAETATTVDIGAITFAVDTPRHTQYLVTKIMFHFADESEAERFREARNLVWLRDMVLTGVRDVRPNYVTADVDLEVLRKRLEKLVIAEVPTLQEIDVALLGRRNVPRR